MINAAGGGGRHDVYLGVRLKEVRRKVKGAKMNAKYRMRALDFILQETAY